MPVSVVVKMANSGRRRSSSALLLKEGFLFKRGEIIKKWVRRYCVLNPQCLCYFKKQTHSSEDVEPLGRIFLDDIINMDSEVSLRKKPFCFCLHTDNGHKRKSIYFHASSDVERKEWIECIKNAKEKERKAERDDPFRKTLKKLTKGLKRIKLEKDPDKGIGCTIKNAAGVILVSRIIEDGPIAATGILKPGDEILDIHGTTVTGKSVEEIVQIIRESPDEFLATVRPIVSVRKANDPRILEGLQQKTNYSKIIFPDSQAADGEVPDEEDINEALECVSRSPSPPPIPPHTKESYILLESVVTLNNHITTDKPCGNGVDKVRQRRPHVYEEIDIDHLPYGKTASNGRLSPAPLPAAAAKKISRSTPDVLMYADLDFRQ